jgi:hypothetical protein
MAQLGPGVGVKEIDDIHALSLDHDIDTLVSQRLFGCFQVHHGGQGIGQVVLADGETVVRKVIPEHCIVTTHGLNQFNHGVAHIGQGKAGDHFAAVRGLGGEVAHLGELADTEGIPEHGHGPIQVGGGIAHLEKASQKVLSGWHYQSPGVCGMSKITGGSRRLFY